MKRIELDSGFIADIDENRLDDIELFDAIVELDGGDITRLPIILNKLLGKSDKKRLYDIHRSVNGTVPTEVIVEELKAIFDAMGDSVKKS